MSHASHLYLIYRGRLTAHATFLRFYTMVMAQAGHAAITVLHQLLRERGGCWARSSGLDMVILDDNISYPVS